jgi:hypothetical protein
MLNKKTGTIQIIIWSIISVFLFSYIGYRAYSLSFTHDESLSYTIIKGDPTWKDTANNHQLNTALMMTSCNMFGDSEFPLRLPNIISFILYLIFCFVIIKQKKNILLFFSGAILLLLNPFILDFFSLARGYGISLALMTGSLYFLLRNCELNQLSFRQYIKDFIPAMALSFAANYSNLALVNYSISILMIFALRYLYIKINGSRARLKELLIFSSLIIICLVFIWFSVERLLWLSKLQQLFFGTDTLEDTINSLILCSTFHIESFPGSEYIRYLIIAIFFGGTAYIFITNKFKSKLFLLSALLIIMITGLFIEYYLFGGKFPKERTAIYFIPLFGLFIYYLLEMIIDKTRRNTKPIVFVLFFLIIGCPLIYNFSTRINLTHFYTWDYEAHTKDIIRLIEKSAESETDKSRKYTISNNWLFEPTLNYYITTKKLNFEKADRNGIKAESDFIYEFTNDFNQTGFEVIAVFPDTKTTLYRNMNYN